MISLFVYFLQMKSFNHIILTFTLIFWSEDLTWNTGNQPERTQNTKRP